MEDASRKILNVDKKTNFVCPVDWQTIRTGMIQDAGKKERPEQDKWDRIINIINTSTQGEIPQVHRTQGETPLVTPGNKSLLRVNINNLNKNIYTL